MELQRHGTQPSATGPEEYFTGTVRVDPLFEAPDPARVRAASVTFEPGARSAWHWHPLGQMLIVTAGCGWVQSEGQEKVEVRPPAMLSGVHLKNGNCDMRHGSVSDEQYKA